MTALAVVALAGGGCPARTATDRGAFDQPTPPDAGVAAAGAPAETAAGAPAEAGVKASPSRVRVTEPRQALCGPDALRRQPDALADLDRDGELERASVVREGSDHLVVRLHRLPDYDEVGRWKLRGDSIQVGSTRCRGRAEGDLWLHVGVSHDPRGESWTHKLYHLEGGDLVVAAEGIRQSNLFVDLDGDGCVDPVVQDDAGGGRVLFGGAWKALPSDLEPMRLMGEPFGHGQVQAVDLDGDGDRDLLTVAGDGVQIRDAGTLAPAWSAKEPVRSAQLATWQGRRVITAHRGDRIEVYAAEEGVARLASFEAESYARVVPELDPAGDGSALALRGHETALVEASSSERVVKLGVELARPLLEDGSPLGPVVLDREGRAELVGVRTIESGHPMLAFPGSRAVYELVALEPPGDGAKRVLYRGEVGGELSLDLWLVDLERDGNFELLVKERAGFSSCDRRSTGASSTLMLLDGDGRELWRDERRTEYFQRGRWTELSARPRAMDLWGDGRLAVRVRAGGQEWFVVPADAPLPESLPVCLQ